MSKIKKSISFMLMFAIVSMFALRASSITAMAATEDSLAINNMSSTAMISDDEVAILPLAAAAVVGAAVAALAVEVLHHHFTAAVADGSALKPALEEGDKLFDM